MKNFKHLFIIGLFLILFFTLQSCTFNSDSDEKTTVITTIFPLYDFTKQISQDKIEVILLLPPGGDPHSYEPSPQDVFKIKEADLFIYTGDFMEIWVENIISELDEDKIINSSTNVNLLTKDEEHEEEHDHEHEHNVDPHVWVDPYNAMIMVDNILKGLIKTDPQNQEFYEKNAEDYKNELEKLDDAYTNLFSNTEYKTIIFGGHFSFGYLANRYNIGYVSPYNGFSSDTLPTPTNIQNLINLIEESGQDTIFYEEMINPKVAEVIAEETGAQLLPLNGAGNIAKDDFENKVTYLDIMYQNIENLKKGLGYNG